jgi:hypothetical protein
VTFGDEVGFKRGFFPAEYPKVMNFYGMTEQSGFTDIETFTFDNIFC